MLKMQTLNNILFCVCYSFLQTTRSCVLSNNVIHKVLKIAKTWILKFCSKIFGNEKLQILSGKFGDSPPPSPPLLYPSVPYLHSQLGI